MHLVVARTATGSSVRFVAAFAAGYQRWCARPAALLSSPSASQGCSHTQPDLCQGVGFKDFDDLPNCRESERAIQQSLPTSSVDTLPTPAGMSADRVRLLCDIMHGVELSKYFQMITRWEPSRAGDTARAPSLEPPPSTAFRQPPSAAPLSAAETRAFARARLGSANASLS